MLLSSLPRTLKVGERISTINPVRVRPSGEIGGGETGSGWRICQRWPRTHRAIYPSRRKVVTLFLKAGDKPVRQAEIYRHRTQQQPRSELGSASPELAEPAHGQHHARTQSRLEETITPHGMVGTNQSTLELSSLPNLNLANIWITWSTTHTVVWSKPRRRCSHSCTYPSCK